MKIKHTKMHVEDKEVVLKFIDYVRLERSKPENVRLEIDTRRVAEYMNLNADQTNAKLANRFADLLERGIIV